MIVVNIEKAREIRREQLRVLRAPELLALDIAYQRADEAGDDELKAEIASRKQALRDVTDDPAIEQAKTVEDLSKIALPG